MRRNIIFIAHEISPLFCDLNKRKLAKRNNHKRRRKGIRLVKQQEKKFTMILVLRCGGV